LGLPVQGLRVSTYYWFVLYDGIKYFVFMTESYCLFHFGFRRLSTEYSLDWCLFGLYEIEVGQDEYMIRLLSRQYISFNMWFKYWYSVLAYVFCPWPISFLEKHNLVWNSWIILLELLLTVSFSSRPQCCKTYLANTKLSASLLLVAETVAQSKHEFVGFKKTTFVIRLLSHIWISKNLSFPCSPMVWCTSSSFAASTGQHTCSSIYHVQRHENRWNDCLKCYCVFLKINNLFLWICLKIMFSSLLSFASFTLLNSSVLYYTFNRISTSHLVGFACFDFFSSLKMWFPNRSIQW